MTGEHIHAGNRVAEAPGTTDRQTRMPKWLLYGLIAKGVIVVLVTVAVLFYAGVI